jgi:hypothetical protein
VATVLPDFKPLVQSHYFLDTPCTASAVEITRTSPISQQALVSGHVLTGTFSLIEVSTGPP